MTQATSESGFTLIEVVAVLAIVSMLAAVALPRWPHATTRPQLEAYALRVAAVLKSDRNAALRLRIPIATQLSPATRMVVSGAGAGAVQLPEDVAMDGLVAAACEGRENGSTITFLPSGMSCGGAVSLERPGVAYRVRVNWLTGGVEVVAADR